jgi:hypothetical protein
VRIPCARTKILALMQFRVQALACVGQDSLNATTPRGLRHPPG